MNYHGSSEGLEPVDELAPPHMPIHGIIRLNYLVMRERAFNTAYGFKVPTDCMAVVDLILNMMLIREEINASNLKKRLAKTLERNTTGPALDAIKLTLAKGMIAYQKKDGKKIFGMTQAQKERSEKVSQYMQKFPDVLKAQMENPNDPTAGSDLLPPEVYFNVISQYTKGA
jgi:hypothetical protein